MVPAKLFGEVLRKGITIIFSLAIFFLNKPKLQLYRSSQINLADTKGPLNLADTLIHKKTSQYKYWKAFFLDLVSYVRENKIFYIQRLIRLI